MFVTKDDNKRHFNMCMGFLAVAAGGTGANDGVFSIWDTGHIKPSSEQTPIFRLPFRDWNTGMPFFLTFAYVI